MNEIWKDIPNYEGMYQISTLGNIRNKKKKILKPYRNGNKSQYLRISLNKEGKEKKYYIHRLMGIVFLNIETNSKLQVDHIDNDSFNNKLDNLQILSQQENLMKQIKNMNEHIEDYKNSKIKKLIIGCIKNEKRILYNE